MKCPYCGGELPDEGTICCHCSRDLTLFKALFPRIQGLEKSLRDLSARPRETLPAAGIETFPVALAALLGVLTTAGFLFVQVSDLGFGPDPLSDLSIYLSVALPPTVLGLLTGWAWRGPDLKAFLVAGLAMGAVNLAAFWGLLATPDSRFNWFPALFIVVVGPTLIFASGGWIGGKLGRGRSRPDGEDRSTVGTVWKWGLGLLSNVLGQVLIKQAVAFLSSQ